MKDRGQLDVFRFGVVEVNKSSSVLVDLSKSSVDDKRTLGRGYDFKESTGGEKLQRRVKDQLCSLLVGWGEEQYEWP